MKVNTLRIPCVDLSAAAAFYTQLLGVSPAFGDEASGYIGLILGDITFLLEPEEKGEFNAGRYLGISIEVEDIAAFYARHKDSVPFSHPPQAQPWGGIMTHVTDPSANVLTFVQT